MSCHTIFELSLDEEISQIIKNYNGKENNLKSIFDRLFGEINKINKDIVFFQNKYQIHKKIIEDLKSENRRLRGKLMDFEVPDVDYRPRNPSPVEDSDTE